MLSLLSLLVSIPLASILPVSASTAQDARPGVRAHHCLVYDDSRAAVVLAGGSTPVNDSSVVYDDLWSFDGAVWSRIGTLGQPLSGLRLAYHPESEGLVAFGGFTKDSRTPGELREWFEGEWSLIDDSPDKAAAEAGFVFDAKRGCFVLFGGGFGDQKRGTTWEWDGTAWATRDVPGPEPRASHGMVYDTRRAKVVLFGGSGAKRLGDTWEWDGTIWKRFEGPGPPARVAPGLAYDSKRGRRLLFGGAGAGALGDTWSFDGTKWEELALDGPPPRISPGLAYDAKRDQVVLFGGRKGWPNDLADTWVFDGSTWVEVVAR